MEQRTQIRKDLFKEGIKGFCKALNHQSEVNSLVSYEDCIFVYDYLKKAFKDNVDIIDSALNECLEEYKNNSIFPEDY